MGLDVANQVDAVGIERETDIVVLTIMDSWNWENEGAHLLALQDKLNAYFAFVESGEIFSMYPNAATKTMRIDVVSRFQPPAAAISFLEKAAVAASQLGVTVRCRVDEASVIL